MAGVTSTYVVPVSSFGLDMAVNLESFEIDPNILLEQPSVVALNRGIVL